MSALHQVAAIYARSGGAYSMVEVAFASNAPKT